MPSKLPSVNVDQSTIRIHKVQRKTERHTKESSDNALWAPTATRRNALFAFVGRPANYRHVVMRA
jgi:hypothetical protein